MRNKAKLALARRSRAHIFKVGDDRSASTPHHEGTGDGRARIDREAVGTRRHHRVIDGLREVDRLTSGLHPAERSSLPADRAWANRLRNERGGTCRGESKEAGRGVQSEMSSQQLVQRICSRARVNLRECAMAFGERDLS